MTRNKLLLLLALLLTAATGAWAQESATTYSVKMKDGTVDAKNWSIASGEKSAKGDAANGLTGLSEGDQVTIQYTGRLKVKGVKATSDAAPAKSPAEVTTAPTAATDVKAGEDKALLATAGTATGGTLMYAVTTTNTKPTSTEGFSATVPTAKTLTAGTYYVWYYVKADDSHTDSEISATGIEVTIAASAVKVTAITLNKTATTITAGQTETLSVSSVTPDDATDQTVTWSSDNEAVATVDADGKVTAVAFGTANITATANDGSGVKATCAVTVSKVVTINQSDWGGWDTPITKDGVTVSASMIDPNDGNLMEGGTFSTTSGNFTKIVVTTAACDASGTGWSGGGSSKTWAGTPASSVSFSGNFMGMGMTQTTIVCTIEPTN